jgi:hypothetical protein
MRIAIDPVPLVLGIYAQAGGLMSRAVARAENGDPGELGRRFGRRRDENTDREVQRLVRAVHTEVKTSDKLLKKTADVWKISAETDLVSLVVHRRGEGEDPAVLRAPQARRREGDPSLDPGGRGGRRRGGRDAGSPGPGRRRDLRPAERLLYLRFRSLGVLTP